MIMIGMRREGSSVMVSLPIFW